MRHLDEISPIAVSSWLTKLSCIELPCFQGSTKFPRLISESSDRQPKVRNRTLHRQPAGWPALEFSRYSYSSNGNCATKRRPTKRSMILLDRPRLEIFNCIELPLIRGSANFRHFLTKILLDRPRLETLPWITQVWKSRLGPPTFWNSRSSPASGWHGISHIAVRHLLEHFPDVRSNRLNIRANLPVGAVKSPNGILKISEGTRASLLTDLAGLELVQYSNLPGHYPQTLH